MQAAGFNTGGFRTYSRTSPNTSTQISPELEGEREKREEPPPNHQSIPDRQTHERKTDRERERWREMSLATVTNILALGGEWGAQFIKPLRCFDVFVVLFQSETNITLMVPYTYIYTEYRMVHGAFYAVPSKPLAEEACGQSYAWLDWLIIVFTYSLAGVKILLERKLKQAL